MSVKPRPRRTLLWIGLILVQLLLMGSAFVGGRMLGQQNARSVRPAGAGQLPSQLPRDPTAATGSVTKIQDTVITLTRARAPNQGGGGASATTDIAVTAETKYYRNVSGNAPGGPNPPQAQVQDATLADVKIGTTVLVWGATSGARVTAEVVYIQSSGR